MSAPAQLPAGEPDLWRALANPLRRSLLDRLGRRPLTTGALAAQLPEVSRFAVMQHLDVLVDAGLVVVERRGRERVNHLNAVPLRRWYERWVAPLADVTAESLLALQRAAEHPGGSTMTDTAVTDTAQPDTAQPDTAQADTAQADTAQADLDPDTFRTVRVSCELRVDAPPARVFQVLTEEVMAWSPYSYGGDRTQRIVVEPRVGGRHFEDWGDGHGHLYGHVTLFDPPLAYATRGRLMPGTTLDAEYELSADGDATIVRMTKVAVGPLTEAEVAGIRAHADISQFAEAINAAART